MSIKFKCQKCGREYSVNEKYAGKRLKCKSENCGSMMNVPEIEKSHGFKKCPECGARMTEKAVACVKCGLDLKTGQKLQAFQKQPKVKDANSESVLNKKNIIVAGIGFAMICFIIVIIALSGDNGNETIKRIVNESKDQKNIKKLSESDGEKEPLKRIVNESKDQKYIKKLSENHNPESMQKQSEDEKYYLEIRNGSIEDWKEFLARYPDSKFADEVNEMIKNEEQRLEDEKEEEAYRNANTVEACVNFLNEYKSSKHIEEIEERILDMLKSIYDYEDFIAKYPKLHLSDVLRLKIQKIRKQLEEDDEKLAKKMATDEVKAYVANMARLGLAPSDEQIKVMLNKTLELKRKIVKGMRILINYHDRVSYKCTGDEKLAHKLALDNAFRDEEYFTYLALTDKFNDNEAVERHYNIYLKKARAIIESQRRVDKLNK